MLYIEAPYINKKNSENKMILRSIVLAMALMFVSSVTANEVPTVVAADSTVTLEVKKMT